MDYPWILKFRPRGIGPTSSFTFCLGHREYIFEACILNNLYLRTEEVISYGSAIKEQYFSEKRHVVNSSSWSILLDGPPLASPTIKSRWYEGGRREGASYAIVQQISYRSFHEGLCLALRSLKRCSLLSFSSLCKIPGDMKLIIQILIVPNFSWTGSSNSPTVCDSILIIVQNLYLFTCILSIMKRFNLCFFCFYYIRQKYKFGTSITNDAILRENNASIP
jgi:hypothetical protein